MNKNKILKRYTAVILTVAVLLTLTVFTGAAAALLKGDLDRNGTVIAAEARKILRISAKLDPAPVAGSKGFLLADVDGNGQILANDARTALRISAKLETNIPLEEDEYLNVCLAGEPESLDPAMSSSEYDLTMLRHLFSGLAKWSVDEDGRSVIVPDAATALPEGVENADGTFTYTYTLRDGLKWSDGKPVTAADFVFAWNRAAAPATGAAQGYLLQIVDGYQEMRETRDDGTPAYPDAKLNVSAPDDKTLTVTLIRYLPYWNDLLADAAFFPVRRDVVANENWADDPATYVCNGPYVLSSWDHGKTITLKKNAAHPDADSVTMETIRFLLSEDEEEILKSFAGGSLAFVDEVSDTAKAGYPDAVENVPITGTYFLSWNINAEILPEGCGLAGAEAEKARAEVRRAFSLLIDRSRIVENVDNSGQDAASGFVSWGISDADGAEFYLNAGHDPAFAGYYDVSPEAAGGNRGKAIEILKKYYDYDAATGKFTNFPTIRYLYNVGWWNEVVAEFIRDELSSVGIGIELLEVEWSGYQAARAGGDYTLIRQGWVADVNAPDAFLDGWTSYNYDNIVGPGNGAHADIGAYDLDLTPYGVDYKIENGTWSQTYDALISVIRQTKDRGTCYKLQHLAEDLLMETGCVCPIYYYTDSYLINPALKGVRSDPMGYKYFAYTTYE